MTVDEDLRSELGNVERARAANKGSHIPLSPRQIGWYREIQRSLANEDLSVNDLWFFSRWRFRKIHDIVSTCEECRQAYLMYPN